MKVVRKVSEPEEEPEEIPEEEPDETPEDDESEVEWEEPEDDDLERNEEVANNNKPSENLPSPGIIGVILSISIIGFIFRRSRSG